MPQCTPTSRTIKEKLERERKERKRKREKGSKEGERKKESHSKDNLYQSTSSSIS
jgi:hypothetical protein